jgi:hypothetical protein
MGRVLKREAAKRDQVARWVWYAENASIEVAERVVRDRRTWSSCCWSVSWLATRQLKRELSVSIQYDHLIAGAEVRGDVHGRLIAARRFVPQRNASVFSL